MEYRHFRSNSKYFFPAQQLTNGDHQVAEVAVDSYPSPSVSVEGEAVRQPRRLPFKVGKVAGGTYMFVITSLAYSCHESLSMTNALLYSM
jgi:hypothetical protein